MIGYPLGVTRYIQQVANKRPSFRTRREGKILACSVPSEEKGEYNRSDGKESDIDHDQGKTSLFLLSSAFKQ